jgi:predicted ATPase/DNA-binding CsgD family transcriptional regulator
VQIDLSPAFRHHPYMISGASPPVLSPPALPLADTTFVGRDDDVSRLRTMLARAEARIVTLTGTGGVGKTRLALEVVRGLVDAFPGGVLIVELGSLQRPERLLETIAAACGIEAGSEQVLMRQLQAYFGDEASLLVLDNFEHVMDAAGAVAALIDLIESLTILITSRESLRILGEREYAVEPLTIPSDRAIEPASALDYDAIRLYVQRAQAVRPEFRLDRGETQAVVEICSRLDGLPLAIELAASRIRVLSPVAMAARIDHRFGLLRSDGRDTPSRHQTLHDTIAWSYDLLDPLEQALFRRLAVFQGGFTAEAAAAIAQDIVSAEGTLALLASLVDKSLVYRRPVASQQPRYAMLETIRSFALARLDEDEARNDVRAQHAEWFRQFAQQAFVKTYLEPITTSWLDVIEEDHDNVRGALAWLEERDDPLPWIDTCIAIAPFWFFRSHRQEGEIWLARALQRATASSIDDARMGWLLHCLGLVMERKPGAIDHLERSIGYWEPLGLDLEIASSQICLTIEYVALGDFERAIGVGHDAIPVFERYRRLEYLADQHEVISRASLGLGRIAEAKAFAHRALDLNLHIQDYWSLGGSLTTLAWIAIWEGEYAQAGEYLESARKYLGRVRSLERLMNWVLATAAYRAGTGHWEEAAERLAIAQYLSQSLGFRVGKPEDELASALEEGALAVLGDRGAAEAFARGRSLPRFQILELPVMGVLPDIANPEHQPKAAGFNRLTERERDVLRLLGRGLSDQEIASELFISRATASRHLANVYRKIGVHSRAAAVAFALEHGLE